MRRDGRAYLHDVREAVALIQQFTTGRDLAAYRTDLMLRSNLPVLAPVVDQLLAKQPE